MLLIYYEVNSCEAYFFHQNRKSHLQSFENEAAVAELLAVGITAKLWPFRMSIRAIWEILNWK